MGSVRPAHKTLTVSPRHTIGSQLFFMIDVNRPLTIGPIAIGGRAFLAPMAGVTDLGMRRAASRFGASLTVSEMVAATSFTVGDREARQRAAGQGLGLSVVQIAGCEAVPMGEAARQVEDEGADIIDINMGCPAKRVTGGLSGSALMRDLDHAARLIAAVVGAVRIPVTVKMRLGWDASTINAPLLARRAEALGVSLVTVHGRTRQQFYTGVADWAAVRAVKETLRAIPLVVNGDCTTPGEARAMLEASGADAVMVGRAALGQPWLVGMIARTLAGHAVAEPSAAEKRDAALCHLDTLLVALGREKGLRHARKHLAAYVERGGAPSPARNTLRQRLVTASEVAEVLPLLAAAFDPLPVSQGIAA